MQQHVLLQVGVGQQFLDRISGPIEQVETRRLAGWNFDAGKSGAERQHEQPIWTCRPSELILLVRSFEKYLQRRVVVTANPTVDELKLADLALVIRNQDFPRRKIGRSSCAGPGDLPKRQSSVIVKESSVPVVCEEPRCSESDIPVYDEQVREQSVTTEGGALSQDFHQAPLDRTAGITVPKPQGPENLGEDFLSIIEIKIAEFLRFQAETQSGSQDRAGAGTSNQIKALAKRCRAARDRIKLLFDQDQTFCGNESGHTPAIDREKTPGTRPENGASAGHACLDHRCGSGKSREGRLR